MSNLNLPPMTYVTLRARITNRYPTRVKLAYETTAELYQGDTVLVRHHGNPIAHLGPDYFTLDNAGWNSVTTANRLNAILRDNQTPIVKGFDRVHYYAACRQRQIGIWGRPAEGKDRLLRVLDHSVAHFSRVDAQHHFVLQGGDEHL